jgi:hypothetical protein
MPPETDRRGLMLGGGAAILAAGLPAAAQTTTFPPVEDWLTLKPDANGVVRFAIDVAVIGNSDTIDPSGRIGPKESKDFFNIDLRGDTFQVEGALYPGGTIPTPTVASASRPGTPPSIHNQENWDFTRTSPSGHWLSRGWVLINGQKEPNRDRRGTIVEERRTEPHLLTEHNYVFGRFGPTRLTPEMLVSNGMDDGNDADTEVNIRAVTGGTGRFRFARGQVVKRRLGRNTTILRTFADFGDAFAPNYRFEFELKV